MGEFADTRSGTSQVSAMVLRGAVETMMAPDNRPPGLGLKSPSRVMGVGVGDAQLGDRSGSPGLLAVGEHAGAREREREGEG